MIANLLAAFHTYLNCFCFLPFTADEPRHALVFAMLLSYALGFAGMLLAYLSYRKRQKSGKPGEQEKHQPPAAKRPGP